MTKYDVFISYSRLDTKIADQICRAFDAAGITYFIDRQGLSAGMEFPVILANAIQNSRIFLFLASRNAYESKFTNSEITYAFNKKSKGEIIPYIIDGSTLPEHLQFVFSSINWKYRNNSNDDLSLIEIIQALKFSDYRNPIPTESFFDFREYTIGHMATYFPRFANNSYKYFAVNTWKTIEIFNIKNGAKISSISIDEKKRQRILDMVFIGNDTRLIVLSQNRFTRLFKKHSFPHVCIYDIKSATVINEFSIWEEPDFYPYSYGYHQDFYIGIKNQDEFCIWYRSLYTYNKEGSLLNTKHNIYDDRPTTTPSRSLLLLRNKQNLIDLESNHISICNYRRWPEALGLYSKLNISCFGKHNSFGIDETITGFNKFIRKEESLNNHFSFSFNGEYFLRTNNNVVEVYDWRYSKKIMTKEFPSNNTKYPEIMSCFTSNDCIILSYINGILHVWKPDV